MLYLILQNSRNKSPSQVYTCYSSGTKNSKQTTTNNSSIHLTNQKQLNRNTVQLFAYYLKWLGLGKDQANTLITETLLDSPAEVRKIEDQIIRYIKYMINFQKIAHATIEVQLYALFHFYSINRVNLNRNYISKFKPAERRAQKMLPTHTNKYCTY